jgi:hypothetical protein
MGALACRMSPIGCSGRTSTFDDLCVGPTRSVRGIKNQSRNDAAASLADCGMTSAVLVRERGAVEQGVRVPADPDGPVRVGGDCDVSGAAQPSALGDAVAAGHRTGAQEPLRH